MSDLISRQDIIGYIDRVRDCGLGKKKSLEYISKYVERVPSAEAVEVVRCKDCKHRTLEGDFTRFYWCRLHDRSVDDTDHCSWGEERSEE